MITWIQTILQKHHKYVFSVLLFFIIIAFVFTIGSSIPFFGDRNPAFESNKNDFYGWNLNDQNTVQHLYMGTYYDMLLNGQQVQNQEQVQNAIFSRAILLSMARDMKLPTASEFEYAKYMRSLPVFRNTDGSFSPEKLNAFIAQASAMGTDRLNTFLLENVTVAKMMTLIGGAGFVQDAQVDARYSILNSKYTFSLAVLDLANFTPEIAVDETKIAEFYEANKARYEVAQEISLKVAFFPVSDFSVGDIAVTDEQLEAFYNAQRSNYQVEKDGKQVQETFTEAKSKVAVNYKKAQILRLASENAQALSDKIYDAQTTFNSDAFKAILAESKVSLKDVPAYRATDQQVTKDFPIEVLRAGLDLNETNWLFGDIVTSEEGAYVVFLENIRPAYIPTLTDIRIQIERDYKAAETYELFAAKAASLEKSLAEASKDAKSFEETAKANGAQVENFTDFVFSSPTQEQNEKLAGVSSILNNLAHMKQNEVSAMSMLNSKAYVFYVSSLEKVALDTASEGYKALAASMSRMASVQSAFSVISDKERDFQMRSMETVK